MAEYLYTGLVSKQLRGNRDDALRLEREARTKVGYLFDSMQPGQTFKTGSWSLGGGRRIMAFVWNDVLGKRATVRLTVVGRILEEYTLFFLESGLLVWNALVPFYPLDVYTGNELKRFPLPQDWDGEKYDSTHWLTDSPWLEYPAYVWDYYVDPAFLPSRFTGLARLAVQAKHGKRRDPREIFATDINPNTDGIFRVSDAFWSVRINSNGVFATRLVLAETEQVALGSLGRLLAYTRNDPYERNMLEADVLGALTKDGSTQEIADAIAVQDIFAAGSPYAYGWKYSRAGLEAAIVMQGSSGDPAFPNPPYYIELLSGNVFIIKFAVVEDEFGVEQLEVSGIEQPYGSTDFRNRPAWHNIFRPIESQYGFFYQSLIPVSTGSALPACCYDAVYENIAPVYCFYDVSGTLQIAWYVQFSQRFVDPYNIPSSQQWGLNHFNVSGNTHGSVGDQIGGFAIQPEHPNIDDFTRDMGQYGEEIYTRDIAASGVIVAGYGTADDDYFLNATAMFENRDELLAWYFKEDGFPRFIYVSYEYTVGVQREVYGTRSVYGNPPAHSLVISAGDAEAAYLSTRGWSAGKGPQYLFDVTRGENIFAGTLTMTGTLPDLSTETITKTGNYFTSMIRGTSTYNNDGVYIGSVITLVEDTTGDIVEDAITTSSGPQHQLHTPHGVTELDADGVWSEYYPESILDAAALRGQSLHTTLSYFGDGLYYEAPFTPTVRGGYTYLNAPWTEAIFIGGA